MTDMICDFCGRTDVPVVGVYHIPPGGTAAMMVVGEFGVEVLEHRDNGLWTCCADCKDDLTKAFQAGWMTTECIPHLVNLSLRSVETLHLKWPGCPPTLAANAVADMHEIFFGRWDGSEPVVA